MGFRIRHPIFHKKIRAGSGGQEKSKRKDGEGTKAVNARYCGIRIN